MILVSIISALICLLICWLISYIRRQHIKKERENIIEAAHVIMQSKDAKPWQKALAASTLVELGEITTDYISMER